MDVVDAEALARHAGLEAGRAEGRTVGFAEGYTLGWKHGAVVGSQCGWQNTSAKVLEAAGLLSTPKAVSAASSVMRLATEFPRHNAPDHDAAGTLQRMGAQYKLLTAVSKLPKLSAPQRGGMSF
jgi:hypothetical protein